MLCSFYLFGAKAVLDPNLYIEKSFMKVPVEMETKLNKTIDFNFSDVNLSEMLVLMSKIGDFNIVFPKELERKVTMQIKSQSIKDTLEDISIIYNYEYEFKNNSVVFKNKNLEEDIELVPLTYLSAAVALNLLNQGGFEKVKINKDPALNNLLLVGNEDQIKSIKEFIKQIDIAPKQKIFLPEFLNFKEIQRFLKYNIDEKADINASRLEPSYILLSGKEEVVNSTFKRLEEIDKPIADQTFILKAYTLDENLQEQIRKLEPEYEKKSFFRIDQDQINLENSSLLNSQSLTLSKELTVLSYNLNFEFTRDILDTESISLKFNDKETFINKESDFAVYFLSSKEIKNMFTTKKAIGLSKNQDVIFIIQAVDTEVLIQEIIE
jgi:hypothetical protein